MGEGVLGPWAGRFLFWSSQKLRLVTPAECSLRDRVGLGDKLTAGPRSSGGAK